MRRGDGGVPGVHQGPRQRPQHAQTAVPGIDPELIMGYREKLYLQTDSWEKL